MQYTHPTKGAANRAKTLTDQELGRLINGVQHGENAERNLVGVYLSFYCGLRAQEIAYLEWTRHLMTPSGDIADHLVISGDIGKKGVARTIEMPEPLIAALYALRAKRPDERYVFYRLDDLNHRRPVDAQKPVMANSVAQFFKRLYAAYGLEGCSSHSGRRTFITRAARRAHFSGCSLKDVMEVAGHRNMATTQVYIEGSDQRRALVNDLYDIKPTPSAQRARA